MNAKERTIYNYLLLNPRELRISLCGMELYALVDGRFTRFTGRNFKNMSGHAIVEFVKESLRERDAQQNAAKEGKS